MKIFSRIQTQLLTLLADGACHSGNELGQLLGVSRTAIWKQIKQLSSLGVSIQRIAQTGYQLEKPIIFLNTKTISQHLHEKGFKKPLQIHLFASINSTNRYLRELTSSTTMLEVCCAETQTEGRGRFGRTWHSPFGEHIYCSTKWRFACDLSSLSGLSLVVSLAIMATLNTLGVTKQVAIKWPNDILWYEKKLSGCLIEVAAESNHQAEVIIGIGLNVNDMALNEPSIDKPYCSLAHITQKQYDRNQLIATLIITLCDYITRFIHEGFSAFINEWHEYDYLKNKPITVFQSSQSIAGIAHGVNALGQLMLIDQHGHMHYFSSGEVSLSKPHS